MVLGEGSVLPASQGLVRPVGRQGQLARTGAPIAEQTLVGGIVAGLGAALVLLASRLRSRPVALPIEPDPPSEPD